MTQPKIDRTGDRVDIDRVREYVRLRRRQRELDSESNEVKELADQLEQRLLEDFAQDGVQNINVDGTTVYLSRTLWAKTVPGVTREQVMDALQEADMGHFITSGYNTQTLSSWLRDLDREGEPLPEPLQGVIEGSETYKVGTRRS